MAITANSINRVAQLDQVTDRIASPDQKWFSLHHNKLDGSHKAMPDPGHDRLSKDLLGQTGGGANANGKEYPSMFVSSTTRVRTRLLPILPSTVYELTATTPGFSFAVVEFDRASVQLKDSGWVMEGLKGSYETLADTAYVVIVVRYLSNALISMADVEAAGCTFSTEGPEVGWWGTSLSDGLGCIGNVVLNTDLDTGWVKTYCSGILWNDIPPPHEVLSPVVSFYDGTSDRAAYWYCYGDYAPQVPGKEYIVGIWVKTIDSDFKIKFYTADNSEVGRINGAYLSVPNDGNWHYVEWPAFINPANSTSDSLSFHFTFGNEQGESQRTWLCAPSLRPTDESMSSSLTINYDTTQSFNALRLAGDDELNEYPVDFTVKLFSGASLLHTETVTNNTQVHWKKQLSQTIDANRMEVTVTKINRPNSVVKITEASDPWEFSRKDAGTLNYNVTAKSVGNYVVRKDDLGISGVDADEPVTVSIPSSDNLVAPVAETSFFTRYEMFRNDELAIKGADVSQAVRSTFSRTDSLSMRNVETNIFEARLLKTDTLHLRPTIEDDNIVAEFSSKDTVVIKADDKSIMTNIHTVMDSSYREIFGKVEITYTDPFLDADVEVTASSTLYPTQKEQTADTRGNSSHKWFSLQENKLDGTYHPIPVNDINFSLGWWGTVMSNSSGILTTPETLKVAFTPRAQYELKVVGDDKLNEFPVDFDVVLRDAAGATIHTASVVNNTKVVWTHLLNPVVLNVASMELVVYKINKPSRTVKILEFFTALKEVYESSEIVSIDLLEEQTFDEMTLPFGNASANEIEISFNNLGRKFDPGNTSSPLYGWLKKNRRLRAWLGAEISPGEVEWYPLGVFWTQEWTTPESAAWASTVALDRLELLRTTDYTTSLVYTNKDLYSMAETILQDAGLNVGDYLIDEALKNIVVPYIWFERTSHRAALVKIAQAALGRIYCDRLGRVVITTVIATDQPIYTYTYSRSIIDLDRPLALSQVTNQVEVISKPRELSIMQDVYKSKELIVLEPGEEYTETITFTKRPVMNIQPPVLSADAGIVVSDIVNYAWGAVISFSNTGAQRGSVSEVVVQGQHLESVGERVAIARDEVSIRDNGKQPYIIESDFIQSTQTASKIASEVLATYSNPRHAAQIESRGNIALTLGNRVQIPTQQGELIDHYITRQTLSWEGSLDSSVDAQIIT